MRRGVLVLGRAALAALAVVAVVACWGRLVAGCAGCGPAPWWPTPVPTDAATDGGAG